MTTPASKGSACTPFRASGWIIAVLVIVLALSAFCIRFHDLDRADLTEDEEMSTDLPHVSFGELFHNISGRPPLPYLAQKTATILTGKADARTVRTVSVLEGVLGVVALFFLAKRIAGFPIALASSVLLCFSHFHIIWSRDARYYPLLMLVSLLYLFCYWEVLEHRRFRYLPGIFVFGCTMPLCHASGYLFLAGSGLAMPLFLLAQPWREFSREHSRAIMITLGGGACMAVLCGILLWPHLRQLHHVLLIPDLTSPLTPHFDLSPRFLFNRLAEVSGVPAPYTHGIVLLFGLGLVAAYRHARRFSFTALLILVTPFVLVWFFRPSHWWHPKYFIYLQPLLTMLTAWGMAWLAQLAGSMLHGRKRVWVSGSVLGTLVCAVCLPNIQATMETYHYPRMAHQTVGRLLSQWVTKDDLIRYTWPERWRIMENYFALEAVGAEVKPIDRDQPIDWHVEDTPWTWYLYKGKLNASLNTASFVLSGRLSRMAFPGLFMAYGPNPQRIQFGGSYPGKPGAGTTLRIPPGETEALDVLFPRAGQRMLFAGFESTGNRKVSLDIQLAQEPAVRLDALGTQAMGMAECSVPFGCTTVSIQSAPDNPSIALEYLEFLPILAGNPLEIPAWDFYYLEGGQLQHSPWIDQRRDQLLLRGMEHGQSVCYRFYCTHPCQVILELTALNDPPLTNTYEVSIPGALDTPCVLAFDREDDTISTLRTPVMPLQQGAYALLVRYIGLTTEQIKAVTRNLRVGTVETKQTTGLASLRLVPVGTE